MGENVTDVLRKAAEIARTQIHDGALAAFLEDQATQGDLKGYVRESAVRVSEILISGQRKVT